MEALLTRPGVLAFAAATGAEANEFPDAYGSHEAAEGVPFGVVSNLLLQRFLQKQVCANSFLASSVLRSKTSGESITDPMSFEKGVSYPRSCARRGEQASGRRTVNMCSTCAATTVLADDFFPQFLNENVCAGDGGCLNIDGQYHGGCSQQTMTIPVLRNVGSSECPLWEREPYELRTACSCQLFKDSTLNSYVNH
ncbi:PREDICTED: uncharacterized protein T16H12.9-like [Priapulus caudatus]|uniref:Uncharacterized protein T16H12.9-like n=1 Tax=Priapulus caudatus TaxID=37621 RepID=A0ABM1EF96_PRICU|nr:PREDICTED: uncharacterized protein T16H12.9-like [Priapulus caudatus]